MDINFIWGMQGPRPLTVPEVRASNDRFLGSVLDLYHNMLGNTRTRLGHQRAYEAFRQVAPDTVISLDDVIQYYDKHCTQLPRCLLIVIGSIGNPCQLDPKPMMRVFAIDVTPKSHNMIKAVGGFVGNFSELHDNLYWLRGKYRIAILSSVNRNGYVG